METRLFINPEINPETIVRWCSGLTPLQSEDAISRYLGKWMRFSATLFTATRLSGFSTGVSATVTIPVQGRLIDIYCAFPRDELGLKAASKGEKLYIEGCLRSADAHGLKFDNCILLDEKAENLHAEISANADNYYNQEESFPRDILIVEPETIIAEDIRQIVRSTGNTVVGVARTKVNAIELASIYKPSIILSEVILMDGSSGIEAVNEIRKSSEVPVVYITAYPERLLMEERSNASILVTKPFQRSTVQSAIRQALSLAEEAAKVSPPTRADVPADFSKHDVSPEAEFSTAHPLLRAAEEARTALAAVHGADAIEIPFGHNGPPPEYAISEVQRQEVIAAVEVVTIEAVRSAPDPTRLWTAAKAIALAAKAVGQWIASKIDTAMDEFAKTIGKAAAVGAVGSFVAWVTLHGKLSVLAELLFSSAQ